MIARDASSTPTSTRVPEHVLTVLDEAYFEYVDEPDYPDGIEEYVKAGRDVLVLRTFSKIYGLAGLRVGYGVGPGGRRRRDQQGAERVRRQPAGAGRRRSRASATTPSSRAGARVNAEGRAQLVELCAGLGLDARAAGGRELRLRRRRRGRAARCSTRSCARA